MKEILLYILLIMIFYDFSLHFLELTIGIKKARKLKYYWPRFRTKGESKKVSDRRKYTVFLTTYWLIAFLLFLVYLLF